MKPVTVLFLIAFASTTAMADSTVYYADVFGGCSAGGCLPILATAVLPLNLTQEPAGTGSEVLVPDFDPSLGTLNDVIVTLDTDFTDGLMLQNSNFTAESFTDGYASVLLSISGAFLPANVTATAGVSGLSDIVPAAFQVNIPPFGTTTIDGIFYSASATHGGFGTSGFITTGLGAFEGPGGHRSFVRRGWHGEFGGDGGQRCARWYLRLRRRPLYGRVRFHAQLDTRAGHDDPAGRSADCRRIRLAPPDRPQGLIPIGPIAADRCPHSLPGRSTAISGHCPPGWRFLALHLNSGPAKLALGTRAKIFISTNYNG